MGTPREQCFQWNAQGQMAGYYLDPTFAMAVRFFYVALNPRHPQGRPPLANP